MVQFRYFTNITDKAYAIIHSMRRPSGGYTILETMIVLAVSALMFLAAVAAFGGRQQEIQFNQAVRDLDSKIQDIINDVAVGFFDNPQSIGCTATGTSKPSLNVGAGTGQGTNGDCVFIGKAVQFDVTNPDSQLDIYTILGRRVVDSSPGVANKDVSNLDEAQPILVGGTGYSNAVNVYPLSWGLKITDVYIIDPAGGAVGNTGGVGFFTSFSSTIGDSAVSNSQNVRIGPIPNTELSDDETAFINDANNMNEANTVLASKRAVVVCLKSANNNKRAAIAIGLNGRAETTLQFDNYDKTKCVS